MTWRTQKTNASREARGSKCAGVRSGFSAYLDGAISGVEMAEISSHLKGCEGCATDFNAWREVQRSLVELGPAQPPARFQARLRAALGVERERGAHLPSHRRALLLWKSSIAPLALRLSGGLAATIMLAGGLSWMFGAPIIVQANDDAMAHLVAPRYLYSEVPPDPITTRHDVPIIVEALVDSKGRVYDYAILAGPDDPEVKVRVENNLLGSIFKPATVFGMPVPGHVVMTYTGVSVRG